MNMLFEWIMEMFQGEFSIQDEALLIKFIDLWDAV